MIMMAIIIRSRQWRRMESAVIFPCLEDGQSALRTPQSCHALVYEDLDDAWFVGNPLPHWQLPEVGTLGVFGDEVPTVSHLEESCQAGQVGEGYGNPPAANPRFVVNRAV